MTPNSNKDEKLPTLQTLIEANLAPADVSLSFKNLYRSFLSLENLTYFSPRRLGLLDLLRCVSLFSGLFTKWGKNKTFSGLPSQNLPKSSQTRIGLPQNLSHWTFFSKKLQKKLKMAIIRMSPISYSSLSHFTLSRGKF